MKEYMMNKGNRIERTLENPVQHKKSKCKIDKEINIFQMKPKIAQFVFPKLLNDENPDYSAQTANHICRCIVQAPLGEGSDAFGDLPVGCTGVINNDTFDRGHLIPKRFGGIGNNKNWLPIFHKTNIGVMKNNEQAVYDAIKAGITVFYSVQGVYTKGNPYPDAIVTIAKPVNDLSKNIPGVKNYFNNGG